VTLIFLKKYILLLIELRDQKWH